MEHLDMDAFAVYQYQIFRVEISEDPSTMLDHEP